MTTSSATERAVSVEPGSESISNDSTSLSKSTAVPAPTATAEGQQINALKSESESVSLPSASSSSDATTTSTSISNKVSPATTTLDLDDEEASGTPPMPNGERRLHPLLDEHENIGVNSTSTPSREEDSAALSEFGDAKTKSTMNNLAVVDASNQYPSPSSGFVPPVAEEDFLVGDIPQAVKVKKSKGEGKQLGITSMTSPEMMQEEAANVNPETQGTEGDGSGHIGTVGQTTKVPTETDISSTLSVPRRTSTASSSSSDDNHSQAISARSSPSTVAPKRRPSSTSVYHQDPDMIPLKVRDFAFTEMDPRHVGARDVSAQSPSMDRYEGGIGGGGQRWGVDEGDDEDEEEEEDEDQGPQPLPIGLYHAAYDFNAESEHELSVKAGQKVRLIGHVDGGWAIVVRLEEGKETLTAEEEEAVSEANKGLVPEAYLEWLG